MEAVILPTEIAQEPKEGARLSQDENSQPMAANKKKITFAEATQSSEKTSSQNSSSYKEALSQPAPTLTHKQRLQWLQKRRSSGLWAQCDDCNRWRFLPHVLDSHELPAKWNCRMNPDKTFANCSVPEKPIRLREEEDLIHGEYSAGSVVWARLAGFPWWPAMVDDCPDTEQYYWLDGFSDIPTHYNVVWFDTNDVTRSWIAPNNLMPFGASKNRLRKLSNRDKKYQKRIDVALTQAEDAERLPVDKRLAKYSFIARYPGAINRPKKITKREAERFQKKLKRQYDIAFSDESESSDDEVLVRKPTRQTSSTIVVQKGNNVLLVGSSPNQSKTKNEPKAKIVKKGKFNGNEKVGPKKRLQDSLLDPDVYQNGVDDETETECNTESVGEVFKQPNSMAVQIGSNVTSTVVDTTFVTDTSTTYVPETETQSEDFTENLQESEDAFRLRSTSPKSDDFDF